MTPFDITYTNYPPPPHPHIPDPSDCDPILLQKINKPQPFTPILVPTSSKGRLRFDPSLPVPQPCKHFQTGPSVPPPKPFTILVLESFDTLSEKYPSDVDTISVIYRRLPPTNSASKHTTSFLDNLLETTSESTISWRPRHRYILRNDRNPTPSLPSTNSPLERQHAQSRSSDSFLSDKKFQTSGVDTVFSQRSSIFSYSRTEHLFSRPTSQNPRVRSSVSHFLNIDLNTDHFLPHLHLILLNAL